MAYEAGQKNPPPPQKTSEIDTYYGRETNGVISWVVNFIVRVIKISAWKAH